MTGSRNCLLVLTVTCLMMVASPPHAFGQAQATTGTIEGIVKDAYGAVLPGANVTLQQQETGFQRELVTDAQGRYNAIALPLGTYKISVTLAGFETSARESVPLAVGQRLQIDFTLGVRKQEETPPAPEPAKAEERTTGLPPALDWTFNFDAGWGSFGFGNSLYTNPKEGVEENLSDQWFEGYLKPALSGTYTFENSSQMYGKISGVGERTYGSVPAAFGEDVSSFQVEDLSIGWRSGTLLEGKENGLDFTIGRAQYRLGHGFLLWDGAAEGGSRGGYWTNARKAFQFAAIGSFSEGAHKGEAFYLDKDELEENDSGSRLWGLNYEFSPAEQTTLGATYMKWFAHADKKPGRDGLNVFNLRAYTAPISSVPNLSFELEYAKEDNGDALDSNAWTLQGAYEFSDVMWKPKLSYRYAFFQGDDPGTPENESFDPLFLGFYDWGTWWQGEIAGEYFLSNSNLISHEVRAHVTPSDAISGGLIFFKFKIDEPTSLGPDVTSEDAAFELDAYTDWKLTKNVTVSVILAYADPEKAVQQLTGRTKNFAYGMLYVAYSY